MRITDLINLASSYLKLGIIAALFIVFCFFIGYFFVYKKIMKGQKKISLKVFLWWGIFICYLCVVLGATLLNRGDFWLNNKIQPLFYSYKDAWINFSSAAWRNIILNFCMFIPLGIWLPLGIKKFRRFWATYLAGFAFTLFIECIQLIFRRGIFELDDILGNTIGTMIGYGLFSIGLLIANIVKKKTAKNAASVMSVAATTVTTSTTAATSITTVAALQLPLIITTAAFTIIFVKYDRQELGNNPYQYIEVYDSAMISVSGENSFSTEERNLTVYETVTLSVEEAKELGKSIFETLGTVIDESRTDIYDNTLVLYSDMGKYSLWIDYKGAVYRLTCFDVIFPEDGVISDKVCGADEETIRNALNAMGFEIPDEAAFQDLGSGSYQFEIAISDRAGMPYESTMPNESAALNVSAIPAADGQIINGIFSCTYYGENGIGELSNRLITCTPYKAYPAISEQEAYNKIVNGEFRYLGDGLAAIQIESCSLEYYLDSKGYYQPNYQFRCVINGAESLIIIPAIYN